MADRAGRQPLELTVDEASPLGVRATISRRLVEIRDSDAAVEPLVRRLVSSFLTRSPERLDRLAGALERGDAAAVAEEAHRLRGSAANLGAEALAARCAQLDQDARAGRLDLAAGRLPAVREGYAEVEPILRALVVRWESEAGG